MSDRAEASPQKTARAIFADAERKGERTLSYLRVAAFLVLVLLLPISDIFGQHHGAQIGMALYGVGAACVLAMTFGRFHRPWIPWALTALDMALVLHLMIMLVAYGGLSPAAALAVPGTLFIFFILAQATLRYRPALIAVSAAVFIAGWVLLHLIGTDTEEHWRTLWQTNELAYVALLILTALTLFISSVRTRNLLMRSIAETRLRASLARFLPANLVEQLTRSGEELAAPRIQKVAVLFADMRGFTAAAEALSPPALLAFLNEYRRRMVACVHENGGMVDKFIGDAVMAVFGVPRPAPDDAARALNCAKAMIASVDAWNEGRQRSQQTHVRISIGAHFGDATVGAIGEGDRLEYTVIGDTVNVAQRIERLAADCDAPLLVSAELLEAAGCGSDSAEWQPTNHTAIRGRHSPVQIFTVGGQADSVSDKRHLGGS